MVRLLHRLGVLDEAAIARLSDPFERKVTNRAGREVGFIRRPAEAPF